MKKTIKNKIKVGRPVRTVPIDKRMKHFSVLTALAFRNQRVKLNMTQEMTGQRIDKKAQFINAFECARNPNFMFHSLIEFCEAYEISMSFQDADGNEILRLNEVTNTTISTVKNH